MIVIGHILLALGLVVALIGYVKFLSVAYRRSLWWFFGCLFIPFVDIAFFAFELEGYRQAVWNKCAWANDCGCRSRAGGNFMAELI